MMDGAVARAGALGGRPVVVHLPQCGGSASSSSHSAILMRAAEYVVRLPAFTRVLNRSRITDLSNTGMNPTT